MPSLNPTEYELHAYIDDELAPDRRAEVAAILRQNPALAARVAAYESDRDLLLQALDGILKDPIPPGWTARIEAVTAPRRRVVPKILMTRRFAIAASVALAASVTVAVRWQWRDNATILAEAEAARDGHLDGRIAKGDPLPEPAKRDALLQETLGMKVRAPDLSRFGFQLVRIDLYVRFGSGAAQLGYADPAGRSLTIFVRPSDGVVQFDIIRRGDTHVCIWQDDVVGAVITARVSSAEMLRIASSAYTSLNL